MTGRRVLITNVVLSGRTGTETFVRDLALGLLRRGDLPVVWSPALGGVSEDIRDAGVPVFDDLARALPEPDVIHGHHHDETLAALARFPDRPGLFVLHDASAWTDDPPQHPRLLRHLAVDDLCLERLHTAGVPEARTGLLRNGVDIDRFRPRSPLPPRPSRALVLSTNTHPGLPHLTVVREACERAGINVDDLGVGAGNVVAALEDVLPAYDVVFAKGRSALEALAVGCAVVVLDRIGLAGMVTPERFAEWRRWNFGRRLLSRAITADAVVEELARYDAPATATCQELVRTTCTLDDMLDTASRAYDGVLKSWADEPAADHRAEIVQLSARLAQIGPLRAREAELDHVRSALHAAHVELEQVHARAHATHLDLDRVHATAAAERAAGEEVRGGLEYQLRTLEDRVRALEDRLRAAKAAQDATVQSCQDSLDAMQAEVDRAHEVTQAAVAAQVVAERRAESAVAAVAAFRQTRVIRARDAVVRSPLGRVVSVLLRRPTAS